MAALPVGPLTALLLAVLAWRVVSTLRQYLRLRHIPGPPSAGISQWWLIRAVGGGRTHLDLYEACQKYGEPATFFSHDRAALYRPWRPSMGPWGVQS